MARIVIGTSGYSYQDWVGTVYPAGTKQQDFLELYSREFKMVELNFSYYRQPQQRMLQSMIDKTARDFLFCIKAHQSLTHTVDAEFEKNLAAYRQGISPLIESGRLGAVLFQFPYSFHYTQQNRKYMDHLLQCFAGIPAVVEFRNNAWQQESVLKGLAARGTGIVNVDEPNLPKLPLPAADFTAEPAYIRFHGRNSTNWWQGDNTSRYDYLYSRDELEEWLPRILKIIKVAKLLLVAFNNHYKGQAVGNARQLKDLLTEQGIVCN